MGYEFVISSLYRMGWYLELVLVILLDCLSFNLFEFRVFSDEKNSLSSPFIIVVIIITAIIVILCLLLYQLS
jgi:hypothetical protein